MQFCNLKFLHYNVWTCDWKEQGIEWVYGIEYHIVWGHWIQQPKWAHVICSSGNLENHKSNLVFRSTAAALDAIVSECPIMKSYLMGWFEMLHMNDQRLFTVQNRQQVCWCRIWLVFVIMRGAHVPLLCLFIVHSAALYCACDLY